MHEEPKIVEMTFERINVDDIQLITALMNEILNGLRQASYFKNFKRGQIILRFDNHGEYKGMKIGVED